MSNNKIKCIIFGAGYEGKNLFIKLNTFYDVLYYVDNNIQLQGKTIKGVPIISVKKMIEEYNNDPSIRIVICTVKYKEIISQLLELKINNIFVMIGGLMYRLDKNRTLMPCEDIRSVPYKKTRKEEKNILFVQNIPCIRTNKIAILMQKRGYKTFLLYLMSPTINDTLEYQDIYDNIFTFFTHSSALEFVNNSEFDIIHSSNTPDYLTVLLLNSKKRIIHDCHDMLTLQGKDTIDIATYEYIANTRSAGVIYPSQPMKEIALKKFKQDESKIFVLENYIIKELKKEKRYKKLSSIDNEIHCVYEGGVLGDPKSNRFYEIIWKKIAESGVHIHFYSQSNENYCKSLELLDSNIHFEGNKSSKELVNEMTKYDCGLLLYNVNDETKLYLEMATPNKMFEYINAEIPVIVNGVEAYIDFVKKYNVGININLDGNIKEQLKAAQKIFIEKDFLQKNGITMEAKIDELIRFYTKIYN